ncbi:hypothetical protein OBBRIDRAFT_804572 [Obba rivulosa]|uniref:F-box domain-containing protein n=1 Tax=Obba rivulosa TaxID=1052685 RepID=A0A8E2AUX1_9APHY|nr:hypothetical protein OBBRIDRAFT_804572 [Obba rivulosa]
MSLEWSTPDRHDGIRSLPLLANELYFIIFDQIPTHPAETTEWHYRQTLASLCLVCRFFRAICQPLLFKTLTFRGSRPDMTPHRTWFKKIDEKDSRSTVLAGYVERCQLISWTHAGWAFAMFFEMYMKAVGKFRNVHVLELRSVDIPSTFWQISAVMRNVTTVLFFGCNFQSLRGSHTYDPDAEDSWTSLSVFRCENFLPAHIVKIISLTNLKSLRALHTDELPLFVTTLLRRAPDSPVEELSLEFTGGWTAPTSLPHISAILARTYNVTKLSLTRIPRAMNHVAADTLIIPSTALPRLQSLRCPVDWAPDLAKNRPVQNLQIEEAFFGSPITDAVVLSSISVSNALLTQLELPVEAFSRAPVYEQCPGLQKLILVIKGKVFPRGIRGQLEDVCRAWKPEVRRPRSLTCNFVTHAVRFDLPLQRDLILEKLVASFPFTQHISFSHFFEWHRCSDTAEWLLYMTGSRQELRMALRVVTHERHGNSPIKDYNGFFASLFSKEEITPQLRITLGLIAL